MLGRVVAISTLLAWCHCTFALDPKLDVSQYAHTAWKVRDGFFQGHVNAMAQTPDGYLWLGTEFGLFRFDGVRPQAWQAPPGEQLPGTFVRRLMAARDGRLWIGTDKGLASWKDGRLSLYPELAGLDIASLLEDREGAVWASGSNAGVTGKLCSIRPGGTHCDAGDDSFGRVVLSLHEDAKGNLWVGGSTGLWRWRPGPPQRYPVQGPVRSLIGGDRGAVLMSTPNGIRQLVDGKIEEDPLAINRPDFSFLPMFRDRDGGLWIGTIQRGLLHVHQGRTDVFSVPDGLSADFVGALMEDREGNIWVATHDGLDRFRDFTVPTISASQGLSGGVVFSVLAAKDGSIWISTSTGLNRWRNGEITIYRKHARGLRDGRGAAVREITDDGLPDDIVLSLCEDAGGRVWVSTPVGIAYFANGRFVSVPGVSAGRNIWSMAADGAGSLWVSGDALFRLGPQTSVERIPWNMLGREAVALALLPDPARGGLWLGFRKGGVAYLKDGRVLKSFTSADGLGEGLVEGLRLDPDGTLWAATGGGLSRLKDDRIATLTRKNGLPCDKVHWSQEDDDHALWLGMDCGAVRISRSELDSWVADPGRAIRVARFDTWDGVRSAAITNQYSPQVTKSSDGRLWFVPSDGVSVIDPRHLPVNNLPPPVHVEQVIADRKAYDASSGLELPPLVRDVRIDYTALSFIVPEKVLFRYRLEGRDRDWLDAGNRRQAFYTDLDPGHYRFRVIACNNSGVWNEEGASLYFSIAPAYWQTNWFRASCVAALIALLWILYRLRLHQVKRQFNLTLDARVNERTRIARELHDTLLQSFHGLLLRFQTAFELLPARASEAKQLLASTIDQAAEAITEGRDAVQGLRSSTMETNDLADAIRTLGEQLAADEGAHQDVVLRFESQGAPRALHPIVRDEIFRIAGEAMRNALRHAGAKQIEVDLRYDASQLQLRVRDDGKGIDAEILRQGGRAGHFGMHGMRERAALIGGKLAVWSALDSGTEVELNIPALHAYAPSSSDRRSTVAEKGHDQNTAIDS